MFPFDDVIMSLRKHRNISETAYAIHCLCSEQHTEYAYGARMLSFVLVSYGVFPQYSSGLHPWHGDNQTALGTQHWSLWVNQSYGSNNIYTIYTCGGKCASAWKGPEWKSLYCVMGRRDMVTLAASLAICVGNSPATDGFSSQIASNADIWCFPYC